ncbi:ribonuclease HII [Secundilactobacillus paracollinoides]|uniref:ribonuclease HII n=1 Tax=Secundilactobacillus paracollinoides TaxID=240427 RepID=UPI0006EF3F7F|nr:ribonuclease HII [Secundilactobacillus paracollinoides]KRL75237.1 ribonuclease HII [Secundilactobacillus paracollinoides DSM 15502 = JCM 11969]
MTDRRSIADYKKGFMAVTSETDPLFVEAAADSRKGVQQLIAQTHKRLAKLADAKNAFEKRFFYENQARDKGRTVIAGIDEVGRGPLAGPVISCAIVLPADFDVLGVNDSKQLSDHKREELYPQILNEAVSVGIGWASAQQIDDLNIYQATRAAMLEAVNHLTVKPQQLLIDAMSIDTDIPQLKLIKGDAKSISIGAASIVAKVFRDHVMQSYDQRYPGYEFSHNAGYGTKAHLAGLAQLGPTPIHRKTFAPVSDFF